MLRCGSLSLAVALVLTVAASEGPCRGADWPMWRCDPNRSGSTSEQLPPRLHLQWVHKRPPLLPAWPDSPRLRFDTVYQPVVMGPRMFLASNRSDSVSAIDVATGRETWRFRADGPVRFAPTGWKGALYVASDDGYLTCLDAATGKPRWRFRGSPAPERKVLGNERLISMWPVRGAPVVAPEPSADSGHAVYFAAGIWPFMGVFVWALDAESGRVLWSNEACGSLYIKQPHDSPAFAGLAPQGYLVATADRLLVPNGRAAAAGLDRETGEFLYFHHAKNKRLGHSEVAAVGKHFVNSAMLCDLETGKGITPYGPVGENVGIRYFQSSYVFFDRLTDEELAPVGAVGVLAGGASYHSGGDVIVARDVRRRVTLTYRDRKGKLKKRRGLRTLWELPTRARPMLAAGTRLYAANRREIVAIDLPDGGRLPDLPEDEKRKVIVDIEERIDRPTVSWRMKAEGTPATMVAANGHLFVVTEEGGIYCYGETKVAAPGTIESDMPRALDPNDDAQAEAAASILKATGATEGYCLVMGMTDGRLAEQLLRLSKLRVVVVEADADKVAAFRRRLDRAGVPRSRLAVLTADPRTAPLPPYLAGLMVSEDPNAFGALGKAPVERLFQTLRPYGGVVCLALPDADRRALLERLRAARLAGAQVTQAGPWTLVTRKGPLPGAGTWTGQYGNSANTCISDDDLVRAPLGLLWFGGPSNEGILPRHGHGPPEQVLGGRLFIEGPHLLRALDVYTGRLLWERELEDVGRHYAYTSHEPGAGALGTNLVATDDTVYIVHERKCLLLDPATGKTRRDFVLPGGDGDPNHDPNWGYLGVWEDLLVAGSSPMKFWKPDFHADEFNPLRKRKKHLFDRRKLPRLVEAVLTWRDFQIAVPPRFVFDPPAVAKLEKGPETQPAGAVPFVVMNFNKLCREGNILAKLPKVVLDAARERDANAVGKWDAARWADDYYGRPKPDNIDDLQASVKMLLATGRRALDDGRDVPLLRRKILEHCYPALPKAWKPRIGSYTLDHAASRELVVMDRRGGQVLWRRRADAAFRHNSICLGAGKLFCIDRVPTRISSRMLRRGIKPKTTDVLQAIDVRTGKTVWRTTEAVFGTWLSYSAEHDILIQAARPSKDMFADESDKRITAYRGKTGEVLWDRKDDREDDREDDRKDDRKDDRENDREDDRENDREDKKFRYLGPCMLHGRTLLTQKAALDLLTGEDKKRPHPLTGEPIKWKLKRQYGCNHVIGSRHLLTFRSAAAGYYDLAGDSGTGNFGGFKSSCTSNLIAADGVLNAPDYTRTCTCSYQNQCSLALVHMPDVDMWTFQEFGRGKKPVRRLGINFGAPGDRMAPDGTFWLEFPFVGGPTPKIEIKAYIGKKIRVPTKELKKLCFRRHSSRAGGRGIPWVAASGIEAPVRLVVRLAGRKDPPRRYTVRLHFAEPGNARKGERIFHVALQGETVLEDFDILAEAAGPLTPVVKTFRNIAVKDLLVIGLSPAETASIAKPVLCGLEVLAEDTPSP